MYDLNTDYAQTGDLERYADVLTALLDDVTSVNIPCCVHDGNPPEILEALKLAKSRLLVVGAHVGYPDPKHRGYQSINISEEDLKAWLLIQLGGFQALCRTLPIDCLHVRPHGALYADIAKNKTLARVFAETVKAFDPWMIQVLPIAPHNEELANELNIQIYPELIIGKRLLNDGTQSLDPNDRNANLPTQGALEQVRRLIYKGQIISENGQTHEINCRTLHISPRLDDIETVTKQVKLILGETLPLTLTTAGQAGWL